MLPISFRFVAASAATQLKGYLYAFKPARTSPSPNWEDRGSTIQAQDVASPYTDRSIWEDRYTLCCLTFKKSDGEQLVMNDAVVAVGRKKNIVTTQLVGMDGTVKEYINADDWQLNIIVGVQALENGVIVDKYPTDGIIQLRKFFDVKEAIMVNSPFLELFDIDKIVITNIGVTQDTACNYQPVSLSALSDTDYNVYSTDY